MDVPETEDEEFFEARVAFVFDDHGEESHEWRQRGFQVVAQSDDKIVFLSQEAVDFLGFLSNLLLERGNGLVKVFIGCLQFLLVLFLQGDRVNEQDAEKEETAADEQSEEELREGDVGEKELGVWCGGEEECQAGGV